MADSATHTLMKWWLQFKELRRHRWLPFFLPIVGTLLYIALAILAIPSELGEKSDVDAGEVDKPIAPAKRVRGANRAARSTHPESAANVNALASAATPPSPAP
jgi:hypothetical protein